MPRIQRYGAVGMWPIICEMPNAENFPPQRGWPMRGRQAAESAKTLIIIRICGWFGNPPPRHKKSRNGRQLLRVGIDRLLNSRFNAH